MDTLVTLPITRNYGWVLLSGAASLLVSGYLGHRVTVSRKVHNVPYPTMYDPTNNEFNNIQRGHQNMLETHYGVLFLMSTSGVYFPRTSAILGAVWSLGRIVFAYTYQKGPEKRYYAAPLIFPSLLGLLGLTFFSGYKLLTGN